MAPRFLNRSGFAADCLGSGFKSFSVSKMKRFSELWPDAVPQIKRILESRRAAGWLGIENVHLLSHRI
jgi:hypothetical protein